MLRLAHLSDVHLGPLPPVPFRALLSKRVTGWINWHRNRGRSMAVGTLDALLADLAAARPDHVAVTGDLTNLALPAEIARASEWLGALGPRGTVSAIPGNHDAYVPGALARVTEAWAANMTGERIDDHAYPYLREIGPLAVIGCSSAEATAPFVAAGPFRDDQARRLEALLARAGERGLFRAVLVHHPPVRGATGLRSRMWGIERFQRAVRGAGAELILHGHTHLPTLHALPSPRGDVPVVGVAAAGQGLGGHRPPARLNLFEIEGGPGAWRCTQIERGLTERGVAEVGRRELVVPGR